MIVKDFARSDLYFSLCGLNCGLCPMRLGDYCPGCGGGAGNQSCAIARCSLQHGGIEYCFQCELFPCELYEGSDEYDSFISYRRQLQDIARIQDIGIEAYQKEQDRKVAILRKLLADYNDGRRKSLFCTAVNLLPLQGLERVLEMECGREGCDEETAKNRAERMASLLGELAVKEDINLQLRKRPR